MSQSNDDMSYSDESSPTNSIQRSNPSSPPLFSLGASPNVVPNPQLQFQLQSQSQPHSQSYPHSFLQSMSSPHDMTSLISNLPTSESFPSSSISPSFPNSSSINDPTLLSPTPTKFSHTLKETNLKLQIPTSFSYYDQQLASPFDVAPFPSPLIGPTDSDDYDSMALFRAFNGRSSPMSAAVSRASSLRRPASLSPQDKKTASTSPSSTSTIAPATIAAATAALTSLKRHTVIGDLSIAAATAAASNSANSANSVSTTGLLPAPPIIPITREKRTVSEYIPISNSPSNSILPPRVPGILVDKQHIIHDYPQYPHLTTNDQLFIQKREEESKSQPKLTPAPSFQDNRARSNSDIKNPPPYRPTYGRSSSSEHVQLIEKLHRERIPSAVTGRASPSPLAKSSMGTTGAMTTTTQAISPIESNKHGNGNIATSATAVTTATTTASSTTTAGTISLAPETKQSGRIYEAYDTKKRRSTWREVSLLGRGAFSRVVLCKPVERFVTRQYRGKSDSILVAIKIVELGAAGGASRDRIESGLSREIDILKTVNHPSLISLYGFNMDRAKALMVLSYCEGGDLFDLAAKHREKLRPQLVRRIFGEVVNAVAYLHENNIVHRDIKLESEYTPPPSLRSRDNGSGQRPAAGGTKRPLTPPQMSC